MFHILIFPDPLRLFWGVWLVWGVWDSSGKLRFWPQLTQQCTRVTTLPDDVLEGSKCPKNISHQYEVFHIYSASVAHLRPTTSYDKNYITHEQWKLGWGIFVIYSCVFFENYTNVILLLGLKMYWIVTMKWQNVIKFNLSHTPQRNKATWDSDLICVTYFARYHMYIIY